MTSIICYLDFMSPQASLAFERLPGLLRGLSYSVRYKPVLLGSGLQQQELLRLAVACDEAGMPNRYVCGAIFNHVLTCGDEALSAARLAALKAQLAPVQDVAGEHVKQQLTAHTAEAIEIGVAFVPGFVVDGQVVGSLDALTLLQR